VQRGRCRNRRGLVCVGHAAAIFQSAFLSVIMQ
jgi:hypothetical protein